MYVHNKVTDRSDKTSNTERETREMLCSTVERCENYSTLSVSIPVFSTSFCHKKSMTVSATQTGFQENMLAAKILQNYLSLILKVEYVVSFLSLAV